jgi:hypothetical protein
MAQVMEREVHQSCLLHRPLKRRAKVATRSAVGVRNTGPSVEASILTAVSVAVNTSFMGTLRLSPFLA